MKRRTRQGIGLLGIFLAFIAFYCLMNCKDSFAYSVAFLFSLVSALICIIIAANQTKS